MIIILEGPDGAGKTTLSEALRQHFQQDRMTQIVKHGPFKGLVAEELCKTYFRAMSQALTYNDHVIMDRCWLSEPIYGTVYRKGANRVDIPRKRMLERVALSRGGVVVHCQPDFTLCVNTFVDRQDHEYLDTVTQLSAVYNEYETLKYQTSLPVVHYDYQYDEVDDLIEKIKAASIQNEAEGGGCFKEGNYLMLCDKGPRANIKAGAAIVPFINFLDNDGPSRMLADTLEREGITEDQCYWINTQSYQGTPTDVLFLRKLKPARVYALGNNAYTWSLNNNVQAQKLPPPLYHMQNYPNQPYHITELEYGPQD